MRLIVGSWLKSCQRLQVDIAASFKHTNPAGVSIERTLTPLEREVNFVTDNDMKTLSKTAQAYILARGVDPKSSFGDFVAISGHVDISLANRLRSEVSDGIIAQSFSNAALDVLKQKKTVSTLFCKVDQYLVHIRRQEHW